MSFLGDLVDSAFSNAFVGGRTDKRGMRVLREGELLTARIDAIRHIPHGEDTDEWCYGLVVPTTAGSRRVTLRQQLMRHPERATLGASVLVRTLEGRVAIDWEATLRRDGVDDAGAWSLPTKQLKEPIPPGIDDREVDRKRLATGTPGVARIEASRPMEVFGMATDAIHLRVALLAEGGATERMLEAKRVRVPPYARALAEPGCVVPVAIDPVRPDRVTFDWATAAQDAAR